jgi:hypothetical protein
MLNAYEECPQMFKRRYIDGIDEVPTWRYIQGRCLKAALHADLRARMNGGAGLQLAQMLDHYDRLRNELLLQCEFVIKPGAISGFRGHAVRMLGQYLIQEAPLLHPEQVDVIVSRKLDENLELECRVDAVSNNEMYMYAFHFYKLARRVIYNDNGLLMASMITGCANTVLLQLILRAGFYPRRYNIFFHPNKLQWFERMVRLVADSIAKEAFHVCPMYRSVCTPRCCQFFYVCRGGVEE